MKCPLCGGQGGVRNGDGGWSGRRVVRSGFPGVQPEPFDAVEALATRFREVLRAGVSGHFADADKGGLAGELCAGKASDFLGEIAHGGTGGGDSDGVFVP